MREFEIEFMVFYEWKLGIWKNLNFYCGNIEVLIGLEELRGLRLR